MPGGALTINQEKLLRRLRDDKTPADRLARLERMATHMQEYRSLQRRVGGVWAKKREDTLKLIDQILEDLGYAIDRSPLHHPTDE